MTSLVDITKPSKAVRTPELDEVFREWARVLYGGALIGAFDKLRRGKPANFYCPSCNRLYSAEEAFDAKVMYELVFPERGLHPPAEGEVAEVLKQKVHAWLDKNMERLKGAGWELDRGSVQIGAPGETTAGWAATYIRGSERLYLSGELDPAGRILKVKESTEAGELGPPRLVKLEKGDTKVYSFKVAGRTPPRKEKESQEPEAGLRCHQQGCREAPLETFRIGTDPTFNPDPQAMEWTAWDKYALALPEPPLGADGKVTLERRHAYVTADYLDALLLEDGANAAMLYLERLGLAERLEVPSAGLPRGWRLTERAAHDYRRKAQWLHEAGVRTPYAQFLRWRERGAGELKEMLEEIERRVREPARIAAARRIAEFPPLASRPDLGESPPESYLVSYPFKHSARNLKITIELKHVPRARLTRGSTTHDRLKRLAWEFLWLSGGQVGGKEGEKGAAQA